MKISFKMVHEVVTGDGSVSFFNDSVNESYHSLSGAEEEAREKYARLVSKFLFDKDVLVVFDVCFGLGYNSAAVLDLVPSRNFSFFCFENDKVILGKVPFLRSGFGSFSLIREFVSKFLLNKKDFLVSGGVSFKMFFGDFRDNVSRTGVFADYILFDPFSPLKVPELWSVDVFRVLFDNMNPGGLLFTYSCARSVRNNLVSAGFEVFDGPCVGRKSPSTIAKKPIM